MSDTEDSEPKKSIFDKITKKQVDEFLESLFIIVVACACIFFYPMIRWYLQEGVALAKCYYNPPVGHGQPLGGHQAPEIDKLDSVTTWPSPDRFFDDYVAESRPVVLQGLASTFPAFRLWTEEYLKEKVGSENVQVKLQNGTAPKNKFDWFWENYLLNIMHLSTPLPRTISGDVPVPEITKCGNFPAALEDVVLWMNNGSATLGLNMEARDGLHCNLRGKQTYVLIDRLQHDLAKKAVTESLELRKLDLCRNRDLLRLPWINATLDAGDCLYIPSKWYKEVSFTGPENLGVSFLYFRLLFFNQSDCTEDQKGRPKSSKEELLKYEIISLAENHATLDKFNFKKVFYIPGISDERSLVELFSNLDADGDNEVHPEDLYSLQTDVFLKFFPGFNTTSAKHDPLVVDDMIPAQEFLQMEMDRFEDDDDY